MLAQLSSLEKQESPDQIEYVLRYFIDSYWEPLIKAFKTIQLFKGDPTGKRVQIVDDYLVKAFKEEALTRVERVNPIFSDDNFSVHHGYDLVRNNCKKHICAKYWYVAA